MSLLAALPASNGNDQLLWVALAGGGAVVLYFMMRTRGKKRDPLEAGPRFPLGKQRDVEKQMNHVLVELSHMAREITAQLDTRAAKLELLIKEADIKIAALSAPGPNMQNSAEIPVETRPDIVVADEEVAALQTFPADTVVKIPQPAGMGERYGEVYALADEGKAANEIARVLQRPTGEIELILALRPK